jgi:hypothetical protein
MNNKTRLNLEVPHKLKEGLITESKKRTVSVSAVVRWAIEKYLNKESIDWRMHQDE